MSVKYSLIRAALLGASLVAGQANGADPFTPDAQPLGYIGPIELSSTNLENGGYAYRGWFENGAWQGDLIEYSVTSTGAMDTSVDLSGIQPKEDDGENWSANFQFSEQNDNYWDQKRQIILGTGEGQTAFRWSDLTDDQQSLLDPIAADDKANSSDILDFIRGDQSNEFPSGAFRQRYSILGDIIHSNPEYVGVPEGESTESSYVDFVNKQTDRTPAVYVGANDGMLHAFNAENGQELWAYVPSMVVPNLRRLVAKPYVHAYFVDGGLSIRDAYLGTEWRTILSGSLGAGGKGLFVLDVTVPELTSESLNNGDNKKVLWEIDDSDNDIGYIFGESTIAQLNDGDWYVINGNGVSSTNGVAQLLLVNIETGKMTKITTNAGSVDSPNGLSAPALVDEDNDGYADIAFAGDIDGDLWKFDLTGGSAGDWKLAYKLYDGLPTQPITVAPDVANHPQTGHLVIYGTGRLYTYSDLTDVSVQAMFGIHDDGNAPGTSTLMARVLSDDTDYVSGVHAETVRTFETSPNIDWATYEGWKVELPAGDRLLTAPVLRGGRIKTTITNPNGYSNWLTEATYLQGTYGYSAIYDLNRDLILDENDHVDNNLDNDLKDQEDIPMAWKRETGNMSQVTMARLEQGYDTLFLNYLNPPLIKESQAEEPAGCVGECTGGIEGGHFDVDTDKTLGDSTDGHVHEYDDKYNLTYIDYFDIADDKLDNITDAITDDEHEFIIVFANADYSPGATVIIGENKYNVVEYQKMIQDALASWNGEGFGNLQNVNADKIVHTTKSLQANGGTLRIQFDSRAIVSGGLHPTETGCVKGNDAPEKGRYRNGALVMHLIDRDHFVKGKPEIKSKYDKFDMLGQVDMQKPVDLLDVVYLPFRDVKMTDDRNDNGVIESDSPVYETYGGILAANNDEFLFETSIFWHYDGTCYGEDGWEQDVIDATGQVPEELFDEMMDEYGYDNLSQLAQAISELETCAQKQEKKGGCKETYETLVALYEMGKATGGADGGVDSETGEGEGPATGFEDLTGEPVVIEGGVAEGGITSGPNYDTGRRTWTDVLPD